MNSPSSFGRQQAARWLKQAAVALGLAAGAQTLAAEDVIQLTDYDVVESYSGSHKPHWWKRCCFWKYRYYGPMDYGTGWMNHTRYHQWRLATTPPLFSHNFGYFLPCWKPVHLERHCDYCPPVWNAPGTNLMPAPLPLAPDPVQPEPPSSYEGPAAPLPEKLPETLPPKLPEKVPEPAPEKIPPAPAAEPGTFKLPGSSRKVPATEPAAEDVTPASYLDIFRAQSLP